MPLLQICHEIHFIDYYTSILLFCSSNWPLKKFKVKQGDRRRKERERMKSDSKRERKESESYIENGRLWGSYMMVTGNVLNTPNSPNLMEGQASISISIRRLHVLGKLLSLGAMFMSHAWTQFLHRFHYIIRGVCVCVCVCF